MDSASPDPRFYQINYFQKGIVLTTLIAYICTLICKS